MQLVNYTLNMPHHQLQQLQMEAMVAGGICGTISAFQILKYFDIDIEAEDVQEGLKDIGGTNQVNMAVFMSKYLDVTLYVNYDIKSDIEKGENAERTPKEQISEFERLLNGEIKFAITPPLDVFISNLDNTSLAQFNFREPNADINHFGLLRDVKDNKLRFNIL
jgi:hypothetical protein